MMKNQNITPGSVQFDAAKMIQREKRLRILKYVLLYLFLVVMAVFIVIPFYWMFLVSLKSAEELEAPVQSFITLKPQFINYAMAVKTQSFNYGRLVFNTVWVGVWSTVGMLITTILAAFAFARIRFKGSAFLFSIFMSTMMIPGEMLTITNMQTVYRVLDWDDTYLGLIVPFMVSIFNIYLLRQNFKQIPDELYYAAKVDGTGDFKYLIRIMIPIGMPTIITMTILKIMGTWNSYLWPNLITNDENMRLISNGLRTAFKDTEGRSTQNVQMAATVLVTVPLLLLFVCLRKYIMRGVSRSGIKG
jgi:multiple sugar transport system permease protein